MISNHLKIISLKVFIGLSYLVHLLVGTAGGILCLSILIYYFSCSLGLGQPYSFLELILWLDQLPGNSKTTIFSSIITICGFLVAFSIGSSHQKQQLVSNMRIEAASAIEEFFNAASRNSTSAYIYAKYLIQIVNHINNGDDENTIEFHLQNVIKETEKFYLARAKLQGQEIEVHRFQDKYSLILSSSWGASNKMDTAAEALTAITEKIWFNTPILNSEDKNIRQTFLRYINEEKCNNYIQAYDNNYSLMNEVSGSLRGGMLGSITGLNFSFIVNFFKNI